MSYLGFHGAVEASRPVDELPTITLLRLAGQRVLAVAQAVPGGRAEQLDVTSESVAIHWAGNSAREISPNAALCIEWPADSVGHPERRMTPQYELDGFWRYFGCNGREARARRESRTTLDLDSVDSWAPANPWPAGIIGHEGITCQCNGCVPAVKR